MDEVMVSLEGIHKSFGNAPVLKGIDLQIKKGEITTQFLRSILREDYDYTI